MEQVDVDAIIEDLRARVQERRMAGEYPAGLEEQLEAEFAAIMKGVHRDEVNTAGLVHRLDTIDAAIANVHADAPTTSRLPGGTLVHTVAARLVSRQTGQLAAATRDLGREVSFALRETHRLIEAQRNADTRQLKEVIASVIDRIALLDHLATAVDQLERRLDSLEQRTSADS